MATKTITMTNLDIYATANALMDSIKDDTNLPVRVGFYLQKNVNKMTELAQEIEKSRMEIFEKYGTKDEEKQQYIFDKENQEIVQKELNDLFQLTQEIKVNMISIDLFDTIDLTTSQIQAISFMIKDNEDEE